MKISNPNLNSPFQDIPGVSDEFLEKINEGIIFIDHNEVIQFVNKKFLSLTGLEEDEVVGRNPINLYKISNSSGKVNKVLQMRKSRIPHFYEILIKDKFRTKKWFRVSSSPVFESTQVYRGSFEIFREITDQKLAENLLQESESRFRNLADASPVMIWMTDVESRFYYFNSPFLEFTGKDIREELGQGIAKDIHPDDLNNFKNILQDANKKQKAFKLEFRLRRADGKFRCMLCIGKPRHLNEKYVGHLGSCLDITEIKEVQSELEVQATELRRSNEELEQFAYVASHDLQEPLRMISSYVQIIERKLHADNRHDLDEFMKYAIDGVGRLQELINDLLNYSRVNRSEDPFIVTDFNNIIERVRSNLSHLMEKHGVSLQSDGLPTLRVDQSQVTRLFQNLIENSIKFRSEGNPEISIQSEWTGNNFRFSISDNGIGIDPKQFDRIFVIFHRLHSRQAYKGTGIGLAICKRIVERHKGRIWVDSEEGKGSTFYFTLKDIDN